MTVPRWLFLVLQIVLVFAFHLLVVVPQNLYMSGSERVLVALGYIAFAFGTNLLFTRLGWVRE